MSRKQVFMLILSKGGFPLETVWSSVKNRILYILLILYDHVVARVEEQLSKFFPDSFLDHGTPVPRTYALTYGSNDSTLPVTTSSTQEEERSLFLLCFKMLDPYFRLTKTHHRDEILRILDGRRVYFFGLFGRSYAWASK